MVLEKAISQTATIACAYHTMQMAPFEAIRDHQTISTVFCTEQRDANKEVAHRNQEIEDEEENVEIELPLHLSVNEDDAVTKLQTC